MDIRSFPAKRMALPQSAPVDLRATAEAGIRAVVCRRTDGKRRHGEGPSAPVRPERMG